MLVILSGIKSSEADSNSNHVLAESMTAVSSLIGWRSLSRIDEYSWSMSEIVDEQAKGKFTTTFSHQKDLIFNTAMNVDTIYVSFVSLHVSISFIFTVKNVYSKFSRFYSVVSFCFLSFLYFFCQHKVHNFPPDNNRDTKLPAFKEEWC